MGTKKSYSKRAMLEWGLYLGNNIKKLKGQTIDKIFEDYEVECAKYKK